jgi:xylulokinase
MEGVAFGMREGLEIFRELGIRADRLIASGGGAASALWRQILADALGMELATTNISEQAAYGAALTAGAGVGIYRSLDEAVERTIRIVSKTEPNAKNAKVYNERYIAYRSLYPALKDIFRKL